MYPFLSKNLQSALKALGGIGGVVIFVHSSPSTPSYLNDDSGTIR